LWKANKRLKRPQTQFPPIRKQDERWARSDEGKAEHLCKIFEPHPREITTEEENKLLTDTNTSAKMIALARPFTVKEVRSEY